MANNNSMASEIMPLGKHKLVLLGDQSVGKSSILNKFVYNVFDEDPHPTVGIDFISKTVECDEGRRVRM
jgi:Ras-related protein Rab-6A